jgi:hypothetical protein
MDKVDAAGTGGFIDSGLHHSIQDQASNIHEDDKGGVPHLMSSVLEDTARDDAHHSVPTSSHTLDPGSISREDLGLVRDDQGQLGHRIDKGKQRAVDDHLSPGIVSSDLSGRDFILPLPLFSL